jgi:hypothetical protein
MPETRDRIREAFLSRQLEEGRSLAAQSDLVQIEPVTVDEGPPCRFIVTYRCKGLVRVNGDVRIHDRFDVGIWFPGDYLRRVEPAEVVRLLGPMEVWHANVRFPFICPGRLQPGLGLVDLVYQIFEILTYHKVNAHDALNAEAAAYARDHADHFPVDKRPLKRRRLQLSLAARSGGVS